MLRMLTQTLGLLVASLALIACDLEQDLLDEFGGPSKDDFDFSTTCGDADSESCDVCCGDLGFDTSLWATGDCGCAYQVDDSEVCAEVGPSFDDCTACCDAAGINESVSQLNGACTCTGFSKTAPEGGGGGGDDGNHDGCTSSGQACTCGNTGFAGQCGTGPDKDGLYCRCD